jgi:hypothetical protein
LDSLYSVSHFGDSIYHPFVLQYLNQHPHVGNVINHHLNILNYLNLLRKNNEGGMGKWCYIMNCFCEDVNIDQYDDEWGYINDTDGSIQQPLVVLERMGYLKYDLKTDRMKFSNVVMRNSFYNLIVPDITTLHNGMLSMKHDFYINLMSYCLNSLDEPNNPYILGPCVFLMECIIKYLYQELDRINNDFDIKEFQILRSGYGGYDERSLTMVRYSWKSQIYTGYYAVNMECNKHIDSVDTDYHFWFDLKTESEVELTTVIFDKLGDRIFDEMRKFN